MAEHQTSKPWWKNWKVWAAIIAAALIISPFLPDQQQQATHPEPAPTSSAPETASEEDSEEQAKEATDDNGLTPEQEKLAIMKCNEYSEAAFPYGVETHALLGAQALKRSLTGEAIYVVDADVTNEFGAEVDVEIQCSVDVDSPDPAVKEYHAFAGTTDLAPQ